MPDKIQRVARGLAELLSLQGGRTPIMLGDEVGAQLELLQYYGLQQLQTRSSTDPAGTQVGVTLSSTSWCVLFGADGAVSLAAAMTALAHSLIMRRNVPSFVTLAEKDYLGTFTASGTSSLAWRAPYPLLCPPNTQVFFGLTKLIGVANANITVTAEFGVLG